MTQIKIRKETAEGGNLEFIGSFSDFEIKCPNILKTIDVEDIYIAEIGEDIDPNIFVSHLIIRGNESSEYDLDLSEKYHEFDLEDDGDISGTIRRNAIVVHGSNKYQILGIRNGNKVEAFAITPLYLCTYLWDLFGADNQLIYNSWYSEGPGPISWEGEFAVFRIRNFLINASRGDIEEEVCLKEIISPPIVIDYIYDWLVDHGTLAYFLLSHVSPKWSDTETALKFGKDLESIAEFNTLDLRISEQQMAELLEIVREKKSRDSQLLDILESKEHPLIAKLTSHIESVASAGGANGNLTSYGDFLENL